jgi:DNA-binding FrmR family transcriptional regulator
VATLEQAFRKDLMDAGTELVKNHIITKVEYAIRVNAYHQAVNRVKTVQGQLTVVDDALFGIDRSLDRLFGRNRPAAMAR